MKQTAYIILLFGLLYSITTAQTLPTRFQVYCPEYIYKMQGNPQGLKSGQDWQEWCISKIKNNDFGKETKTVWTVYSDRANNQTYTAPSSSASRHSTLGFCDKLFVADVKNGYALVFTDDYKDKYPIINSSAQVKGWIPVENLLLWEICPKTRSQIFQKGLVVHDPTKQSATVEKNPPYLLEPKQNASTNKDQKAKELDILFIMKTARVGGMLYYLLSKEMNCANRERVIYGWLPEDYITRWDQRMVLEPTYATMAVRDYQQRKLSPSIFSELSQAKAFYSSEQTGNPFWIDPGFSTKRMDAYIIRNPIKEEISTNVFQVAAISSLGTNLPGPEVAKMKAEIEKLKEAQSNINVIFVIDATTSMTKYYKPVADALSDIMRRDFFTNIKVGAVLYKDYIDPDCISYKAVTSNINEVIGFITSAELGSIDKDHWEAMFLGIETALDVSKMRYDSKHSNFIILIGDAGNHRIDPQGREWQDIVVNLSSKMLNNNINFLAYQVNHYSGFQAYDDFAIQLKRLQSGLADKIKSKIKSGDLEFKLKSNRFYILTRKGNNEDLPVYVSYKYAEEGTSETTQGLQKIIIENIVDFEQFIEDRLKYLETTIINSDNRFREEEIIRLLRWLDWSETQINNYIKYLKQGGSAKILGYAPVKTSKSNYKLFDYVLFFSQDELTDLIQQLNKINSPNVISSKKACQDAVISMGQAMLGQFNATDIRNMDMDELLGQIYGIPVKVQACGGIRIDQILNMEQSELDIYIKEFRDKLQGLKSISSNSYDGRFKSNGVTYYWIPLSKMPGLCEEEK